MDIQADPTLAFTVTFIAGISTSIGAAAAFFVGKKDMAKMALAMSFSAGVMIFVSFMGILPSSMQIISKELPERAELAVYASFFAGAAIAWAIDALVPEHIDAQTIEKCADCPEKTAKTTRGRAMKTALMAAIALSIHNFPEGISVFFTTLEDTRSGIAFALAILLHNIPEGIAVALPVYNSTGSKKKAFLWASFSGLAEPAGALIAFFALGWLFTPAITGACMAATGGLMVYIALDELLPMAREHDTQHATIIGVFAGMGLVAGAWLL